MGKTTNFFTICRVKSLESELISISPPAELPLEQIGFSNMALDPDRTIRRQILGMSADRVCQSDFSLSLRLAISYLDNIPASFTPSGLQIGDVVFAQLQPNSGGYQLPQVDAQGYQILLNYRSSQPETISLREILNSSQDYNNQDYTSQDYNNQDYNNQDLRLEKLVPGKIVFIGGKGHNRDLHHTPYSRMEKSSPQPGVFIYAQMTQNIINTVLGESTLLWWVPDWIEFLWIGVWSIIGAGVVVIWRSFWHRASAIFWCLTLLFGCCLGLFFYGGWIVALAPGLAIILAAVSAIYLISCKG